MTSKDCENCERCEKCKSKSAGVFSPIEILGYTAIGIGLIGVVFQMQKSHSTMNLESFSVWYLITAGIAELLFLIQGIMIQNVSISLTRAAGVLYFGFFLFLFLRGARTS